MNPADADQATWPTRKSDSAIVPQDTLAGAAPPPVYHGSPPSGPAPDRRFGAGMLLALTVIALAATGVAIAYFLTHQQNGGGVTTVVQRSTAPATVATNAERTKVSAKPAARRLIPDLTGRSLPAARSALAQLGLKVDVTRATSDQPDGTIVDQAPKPGAKLARGSAVTLSVASSRTATTAGTTARTTTTTAATTTAPAEPTSVTVPDVSSQNEAAAVQSLARAGILPSLAFVPGNDPLGTVTGQGKAAGSTVPYHAHVQINISSGPGDKAQESIPNVIGQTLQQAVSTVNGAHLRLIYVRYAVDSRAQAGKIVQQSPLGGGHAPQNAQILVFLGAFRG